MNDANYMSMYSDSKKCYFRRKTLQTKEPWILFLENEFQEKDKGKQRDFGF